MQEPCGRASVPAAGRWDLVWLWAGPEAAVARGPGGAQGAQGPGHAAEPGARLMAAAKGHSPPGSSMWRVEDVELEGLGSGQRCLGQAGSEGSSVHGIALPFELALEPLEGNAERKSLRWQSPWLGPSRRAELQLPQTLLPSAAPATVPPLPGGGSCSPAGAIPSPSF